MEVSNLYPQYNVNDRRQQDVYIEKDRRLNADRRLYIDEKLRSDIKEVKDIFYKIKPAVVNKLNSHPLAKSLMFLGLVTTIPSARRIVSVEDNIQHDNNTKAVGLGLIGLINVKEDLRDLMSLFGRSKSQAPEGYYSKYKFFAGTPVETLLKKTKHGSYILNNIDTTLADTNLSDKILDKLNIKEDLKVFAKEINYPVISKEIVSREYVKYDGFFLGKLAGLTLNRITKLGLLALTLLELPLIYNSIKNDNDYNQAIKSVANVLSCSFCGAFCSALFALLIANPASSVIGLGVGLFIGNNIAKRIACKVKKDSLNP